MIPVPSTWPLVFAWADADELPHLPRSATYLIAVALVVIWMILRVQILRQRDRNRAEDGEGPLKAWRWLRWLAAGRSTVYVLVAIALSLLAAAGVLILNT